MKKSFSGSYFMDLWQSSRTYNVCSPVGQSEESIFIVPSYLFIKLANLC